MTLFIPKRLIIKPQSEFSETTKEILKRTRRYNPNVEIVRLTTTDFKYPVVKPRDKFLYMKDSAIISQRSESFIRTFDSPGHIVERLTTVFNLSWMCPSRCQYCYLQTNQTPEHYFYTNFGTAENEIASSAPGHTAILTLWTHLTHYFNKRLNKLPDRFKEASDWMRDDFVSGRMISDSEVIDRYYLIQNQIVDMLNDQNKTYQIDFNDFKRSRETIKEWYQANKAYPLILTPSEYCDLFAVDHLTGNSAFLMKMVEKYPPIKYTVRTKSAYVDEMLKYDGLDRVKIQIVLNTDNIIERYEQGTATLDERIHAARKVQEATGFKLGIVFEPMILHEGYENGYSQLMKRVFKDLDPKKIATITLGSLRFSDQLMASAKMHFPRTTILDKRQKLIPPVRPDTKHRYTFPVRKNLYSKLISTIHSHGAIPVKLGTEEPAMWEALKLKKDLELDGVVYENILKGSSTMKKTKKQTVQKKQSPAKKASNKVTQKKIQLPPAPVVHDDDEDIIIGEDNPFQSDWRSIAPQDYQTFETVLRMMDEGVSPLDSLIKGMIDLQNMSTIRSDEEGNSWIVDNWKEEEATTFQAAIQSNRIFRPIKVVGNFSTISPILPFNIGEESKGFISFALTDSKRYRIETQLVDITKVHLPLDKLLGHKGRATFYGMVIPYYSGENTKKRKRSFRFFLHDFILSASDFDTLTWQPSKEFDGTFRYSDAKGNQYGVPINHPTVIIKNNPQPNQIIAYIKSELTKHLKIVALQDAKELDRALEFVILQSLSQGYEEILQKLHMLVIGPPTAGKSYLTKAALALNVVGQEITSSKMKISAAGLIGTVKTKSSNNISVPGIIPNNSSGVVCIQEFHEIVGERRREVCGIFLRMMEEGKVIDSTSGNTLHIAETALLLDQNRYSDLYPNREFDTYSDFDIPVPVLARFDHIMLMSSDSNRAKKVSDNMVDSFDTLDNRKSEDKRWIDDLKYLVAYLRNESGKVDFPNPVRDRIKKEFNKAIDALPNIKELETLVDNMRIRLMRSVIKISRAVATANASKVVTEAHVEYAMTFVQDKLNFLKSIHPEDIRKKKPLITNVDERRELIRNNFLGSTFTTKASHDFILENMEGTVDERTITRDLGVIGASLIGKKKGLWTLGVSQGKATKRKIDKLKAKGRKKRPISAEKHK